MTLNRRHKAGLFLVLVVTGLSLLFDATPKQIAGLVLLGGAATWVFGSLSLRVLGVVACSMACVVGLGLAVVPILDARSAYVAESESYDVALAETRAAVARADVRVLESVPIPPGAQIKPMPRPPKGFVLEPPATLPADFFAKLAEEHGGRPAEQKREVYVPEAAQNWLRMGPWTRYGGVQTMVSFPADATDDAIMNEFQTKHLRPRPTFSVGASIVANPRTVGSGVVLFAGGLLGFAGMLWRKRLLKSAYNSAKPE